MKKLCRLLALLLLACTARAEEGSVYDLSSAWQNQAGQPVQLKSFSGKPQLFVLFFSHCTYACPRITADLKAIEAHLTPEEQNAVGFVMASFDSERDTPEMLRAFADAKALSPARWTLLHGEPDAVRELAAVLNVRYRREEDGSFAHSNLITLLDAQGHIVFQREGLEGDPNEVVREVRKCLAATKPGTAP